MAFDLEKLFVDVFAPQSGDVVTILYDLPHGEIPDREEWQERREMAKEWHQRISRFSGSYGVRVNPMVTYDATGADNADLPEYGMCGGKRIQLESVLKDSTIIFSMPQYSASAPLITYAKKYGHLRIARMPMAARFMEETGLSADLEKVAANCSRLARLFERSDGIEVTFSTGHTCHFDISDHKPAIQDNGMLHPGSGKNGPLHSNLPAGEVFTCPNEAEDSRTSGEIPADIGDETIVFVVRNNQIIGVQGDGPIAEERRQAFRQEVALRNIAEVAIGCNDKAVVTGNALQDMKAGFTWAYGRSDALGGKVGPGDFTSPDRVCHIDMVYARGNGIFCSRFDFLLADGTRKTAMIDGVLCVQPAGCREGQRRSPRAVGEGMTGD